MFNINTVFDVWLFIEGLLDALWSLLECSWQLLGGKLGPLGAFWGFLEASLGLLDASWGLRGASWEPLGDLLGPLGPSWGGLGAV